MAEIPLTLIHQPPGQGSNLHSLSPTHDSAIGYSPPPQTGQEISYQHLFSICPITYQFTKGFELIPIIQHLPYTSRKPKITPTRLFVSSVEEAVLATLEGLTEAIEDGEEPLVF